MVVCIETATNLCSVALCNDAGVISLKESDESKSHAAVLTVFIEDIFKENQIKASDLEAVAVSKGPGSYTGLRIGVSAAKGIAYAVSIPLIGIETTLSMFWGIKGKRIVNDVNDKSSLFCPMLDARRMEVYYALYDSSGNTVKNISAEIIDDSIFSNFPVTQKIIVFGDGAAKCKEVIKHPGVTFFDDFRISASHMRIPVSEALKDHHFEDVAYFEPFYLKDFITSKPKKNIFGK